MADAPTTGVNENDTILTPSILKPGVFKESVLFGCGFSSELYSNSKKLWFSR
jgi:hypothetical protein